ncbi:MAG: hypothetical protein FJX59_09135 [Alphaproteobacteria bacterium]|nr:hypothetical protein [Alphaproteobacteria bacterium]
MKSIFVALTLAWSTLAVAGPFEDGLAAFQRKDYAAAIAAWQGAADQGDAAAQTYYAFMLKSGLGVAEDDAAALRLYRRAAESGYALAQYSLAGMYDKGEGASPSLVEAYTWYALSIERFPVDDLDHRGKAAKGRDGVAARLTPAQLADAKARVAAWTPGASTTAATPPNSLTFSIIASVIVRSPDPMTLASYYEGLGFIRQRELPGQGVLFHLQNHQGTLEIIRMDPKAKPSDPKKSRTEQSVLAIFETDQLDEVLARAKKLGSPVIDTWTHPTAGVSIHYIADPENNFLGFTKRGHNPTINTPER